MPPVLPVRYGLRTALLYPGASPAGPTVRKSSLSSTYETPELTDEDDLEVKRVEEIIPGARGGHTLLNEWESKELLATYGLPAVETRGAHDEDAVWYADEICYPVVLKLYSASSPTSLM
jgi:acyl-CoA synthetase (NDP forming)